MTSQIQHIKKYIILMMSVVLLGLGLFFYVRYTNVHPETDDAYVNAHFVAINTRVSGEVRQVYIKDDQFVEKGQLLFALDARPFVFALQQAQANLLDAKQRVKAAMDKRNAAAASLEQARADVILAQSTFARYHALYAKHYVAKQTLDEQSNQLAVAKAKVHNAIQQLQEAEDDIGTTGQINSHIAVAQSAVQQALLNLQDTKVYAPNAGRIAQFSLHAGDSVSALQTVFNLIDNHSMWVDAHFKETQVGKMHVGMPAAVTLDMYPGHEFKGQIESIAYGSGDSFSILPSQNDSGNWVKVTQRFTVKIDILNAGAQYPLRVGSSAAVRIHL